nr:hypothetical protein [Tanacetum cinerariifolium]
QAFTSGTQLDKAPVYDTNDSGEVQLNDNCYDNKIFNMFTQEQQYTDLLEPIFEPQLVSQNDNHVTSVSPNINDPTEAMNAALILFAKSFQLTTPTNNKGPHLTLATVSLLSQL